MSEGQIWGSPSAALDRLWVAGIKQHEAVDYLLLRLSNGIIGARAALAIVTTGEFVDRHEQEEVPKGLWLQEPRIGAQAAFWDTGDALIERSGFDTERDRRRGPVQLFGVQIDLTALEGSLATSGSVIAQRRKLGRPAGSGGYILADEPLIEEMQALLLDDPIRYSSATAAAELVAERAEGTTEKSNKIARLVKRHGEKYGR